jgi:hypothetical protein
VTTEIQPRTTGLEELDFVPPCGRHTKINGEWTPNCEEPAAWFAILGCCGHTILLCDKHKTDTDWICLTCKARNAKVIHWERI